MTYNAGTTSNTGFNFESDRVANAYRSLFGLIKYNNGFFKSGKQSWMFMNGKLADFWGFNDEQDIIKFPMSTECREVVEKVYGIPVGPDQKFLLTEARMRWVDYGYRSYRRVAWAFVIDSFGVVAKYKLKFAYEGNTTRSWVDPTGTVCEFHRAADASMPVFEEPPKVEKSSSVHVGEVGKRLEVPVTVERVFNFGFNQWGESILTILKDDSGNTLKVWKYLTEVGTKFKLRGTVKNHEVNKRDGSAETTLTRVKIL